MHSEKKQNYYDILATILAIQKREMLFILISLSAG